MKRVTIINLAGRAWHVEDDGVALVEAWLDDARARLTTDPDRDELLADFERAIADKCEERATSERDVVTADDIRSILDTLGTVEPAEPLDDADQPTERIEPMGAPASNAGVPWRERRLYRLTGPGEARLAGVCSGIAAYTNVDVTVVRVLTVILAIMTGGGAAIAYIAMAMIVPEARSPEERAAVRGYGESAQEMMSRARAGAGPALSSLGSLITNTWRICVKVLHAGFITVTWVFLATWALAAGWLLADGDGVMSAFDDGTSRWLVALWVTCAAWIVVSVTLRLSIATGRDSGTRRQGSSSALARARGTAWIASVLVAFAGLVAIPASASEQLRSIGDGSARIDLFGETICIDDQGTHYEVGYGDQLTEARIVKPPCRPGDVAWD